MKHIPTCNPNFTNKANKQTTPKFVNKTKSPQTPNSINKTTQNSRRRSVGSIGVKRKYSLAHKSMVKVIEKGSQILV
jgi:hypothetical protein